MFSIMRDAPNIDKRCVFQSLRVIGNCCIDDGNKQMNEIGYFLHKNGS